MTTVWQSEMWSEMSVRVQTRIPRVISRLVCAAAAAAAATLAAEIANLMLRRKLKLFQHHTQQKRRMKNNHRATEFVVTRKAFLMGKSALDAFERCTKFQTGDDCLRKTVNGLLLMLLIAVRNGKHGVVREDMT
mmetsp:Transcript_91904/g.148360  ORF Transcript_91904/g.148360 Transcript_91904/m.148360 type:complete len:134 (-) Transcript_91904:100-501(-)|eukprot:CAMPEP_0179443088 /NCGR_PEP_ID=MMETSP0799-20121207/26519_1 /TAXON_ID=46947 /ORGANISM="Geminigera cryophila, Strain CCMP2564" /LENGTH=133 /DNA_ID=CAMNT_0021228751 /DNA_START=441 /DNA_END=842 /DNA_ORIENTATION=+